MSQVLVIDDDPDIRTALRIFLKDAGYTTAVAEEGLSGIEKAVASPPDVILLDIMMPNVDGFGVVSALKEDPATSDIPIIMLSAVGNLEAVSRAFALGARDYLDKPCTRKDVLNAVKIAMPASARPKQHHPWPNWELRV